MYNINRKNAVKSDECLKTKRGNKMKKQFTKLSIAIAALTAASLGNINAQSFEISSVVSQTVGISASLPDIGNGIPASGNASNTAVWSTGQVGLFGIDAYATGNTPPIIGNYYLQVVASTPTGTLVSGTDSLMVARTVNSQGLTDDGTLSVYVRPVGTNTTPGEGDIPAIVPGAWSLTLTFNFFSDEALTTPVNVDLLLTSLDIDFNQKYYSNNTDFDGGNFVSPGTQLTAATPVAGYTGFTAAGNSSFDNPDFAVSSAGTAKSSYSVQVSHDNQALYMFEFRNPSEIIPEPSTAALATISGFLLVGFMRRMRRVS